MRYEQAELEAAYQELVENEKPVGTFVGALIGAIPAGALYVFYGFMGGIPGFFMLLPAAVVALFARFTGRPFRLRPRIPVGIVAFAGHIAACTLLLEVHPIWLLLAPANAGIAVGLSKVNLSRVQSFAVGHAQLGLLRTQKDKQSRAAKSMHGSVE